MDGGWQKQGGYLYNGGSYQGGRRGGREAQSDHAYILKIELSGFTDKSRDKFKRTLEVLGWAAGWYKSLNCTRLGEKPE